MPQNQSEPTAHPLDVDRWSKSLDQISDHSSRLPALLAELVGHSAERLDLFCDLVTLTQQRSPMRRRRLRCSKLREAIVQPISLPFEPKQAGAQVRKRIQYPLLVGRGLHFGLDRDSKPSLSRCFCFLGRGEDQNLVSQSSVLRSFASKPLRQVSAERAFWPKPNNFPPLLSVMLHRRGFRSKAVSQVVTPTYVKQRVSGEQPIGAACWVCSGVSTSTRVQPGLFRSDSSALGDPWVKDQK